MFLDFVVFGANPRVAWVVVVGDISVFSVFTRSSGLFSGWATTSSSSAPAPASAFVSISGTMGSTTLSSWSPNIPTGSSASDAAATQKEGAEEVEVGEENDGLGSMTRIDKLPISGDTMLVMEDSNDGAITATLMGDEEMKEEEDATMTNEVMQESRHVDANAVGEQQHGAAGAGGDPIEVEARNAAASINRTALLCTSRISIWRISRYICVVV